MSVTISGTGNVLSEFQKILRKVDSPEVMRRLGNYLINVIRVRTRAGRGVKTPGGNPSRLKPVSLPYAKWRQKQKRHAEAATGRESNLTFSGKMLNDMLVKRANKSSVFIGFKNHREEKKAEYQEAQGRRFLVLSGKEIRSAADFLLTQLTR